MNTSINSRDYPLTVAQDIKFLQTEIKKLIAKNNTHVFYISDDYIVSLLDGKGFYLYLHNPASHSERVVFTLSKKPSSKFDNSHANVICFTEEIIPLISSWIEIIKEYNEIIYSEEELIQNFYEQEFLNEFEILDENADIEPFSFEQQEKLNMFLISIENTIESNRENIIDADIILEDTKRLIAILPQSTKKQFIKDLSKLAGKIRKYGVEFFKTVFKEAIKEGIKGLLEGKYTF